MASPLRPRRNHNGSSPYRSRSPTPASNRRLRSRTPTFRRIGSNSPPISNSGRSRSHSTTPPIDRGRSATPPISHRGRGRGHSYTPPIFHRGRGRGRSATPPISHRGRGRGRSYTPPISHRGRGRGRSDTPPISHRGRGRGHSDTPPNSHRGRGRGRSDTPTTSHRGRSDTPTTSHRGRPDTPTTSHRGRGRGHSAPSNRGRSDSPLRYPSFSDFAIKFLAERNKKEKDRVAGLIQNPNPNHNPNPSLKRPSSSKNDRNIKRQRSSKGDQNIDQKGVSEMLKVFMDGNDTDIVDTLSSLRNIPVRSIKDIDAVLRLRNDHQYKGQGEIAIGLGFRRSKKLRAYAAEVDLPLR